MYVNVTTKSNTNLINNISSAFLLIHFVNNQCSDAFSTRYSPLYITSESGG